MSPTKKPSQRSQSRKTRAQTKKAEGQSAFLRTVADQARAEAQALAAKDMWPSRWWREIEELALEWSVSPEYPTRSRAPSTSLRDDFVASARGALGATEHHDFVRREVERRFGASTSCEERRHIEEWTLLRAGFADAGIDQREVEAYLGHRFDDASTTTSEELLDLKEQLVRIQIQWYSDDDRRIAWTEARAKRAREREREDEDRIPKLDELRTMLKWYEKDLHGRSARDPDRFARALEACSNAALHVHFDRLACIEPPGHGRERRAFTSLPQACVIATFGIAWEDDARFAARRDAHRAMALFLILTEDRIFALTGNPRPRFSDWRDLSESEYISRLVNTVRTTVRDLEKSGGAALVRIPEHA